MAIDCNVLGTAIDQVLFKHPHWLTPGPKVVQQVGKCCVSHFEGILPIYKG